MSEPVTPLNNVRHEGFVTIQEIGPLGMVSLRADLGAEATRSAVAAVTGGAMPEPGRVVEVGDNTIAWMSPDELMLVVPASYAARAAEELGQHMGAAHHLVANVSDMRAVFRVSGEGVRDALSKLTPADLSPAAFTPGTLRRTRLAQVAGAILLRDDTTADVFCFRSVAVYVFDLLCAAGRPGSEVGLYGPKLLEQ